MPFTPIARQLNLRLESRLAEFRNWMFQWHALKNEGGLVEVDLFDGRKSHLGGIAFSGSARITYWDALARGLRLEIASQFDWLVDQLPKFSSATAEDTVEQAVALLQRFAQRVRQLAAEGDRLLRGDGVNLPELEDRGNWYGSSDDDISAFGKSILASQSETEKNGKPEATNSSVLKLFWHERQAEIGLTSLALGILGILVAFI